MALLAAIDKLQGNDIRISHVQHQLWEAALHNKGDCQTWVGGWGRGGGE